MIIKSKHNYFIYNFIKLYTRYKISRNFHKVYIHGNYCEKKMPVILLSNHVSWWDGFWAMYLNIILFKRKFHFMMLEDQLRKYSFFKYCGGYSVKKNSRSMIESLDHSIDILSEKNNLLLLFPQGQINSLYKSYFKFERGIEKIIASVRDNVQVIFIVNLVDYFSMPKPTLFMYFKEYEDPGIETEKIEKAYNVFYAACIAEQNSRIDVI